MDDIFVALLLLSLVTCAVALICFIVKWITKKPKKKCGIVALMAFILFWVVGISWGMLSCDHEWNESNRAEATCDMPGFVDYNCSLCEETKSEKIDSLGHDMQIISQTEPTETLDGEIVRQCSRCDYSEIENVGKLSNESESTEAQSQAPIEEPTPQPTQEPESTNSVFYDEIYRAYKENELRADDTYKNNRYQITAKINGMETGGLFNLTGGATLTMEVKVDNTIVFFYAEFEEEQEEALKIINVGDTITFEGECLSAGTWVECELLQ